LVASHKVVALIILYSELLSVSYYFIVANPFSTYLDIICLILVVVTVAVILRAVTKAIELRRS